MTAQRVRASNADRERVVGLLNQALAEERISLAEFDERSTTASVATWADELPQLTADLARRATHAQRAHVIAQLTEAAAQGYIRLEEFEERSAAVNQMVWSGDLAQATDDLPQTFFATPDEGKERKKFPRAAIISAVAVVTCTLILFIASRTDSRPVAVPASSAPAPVASPSTAPVTTAPTSPPVTTTPPQPTTPPPPTTPPASAITITCDVGGSDDEVTFTSVKQAWAANGGTYFCEAEVPDSHRLTSAEKAAVVIDQRTPNGDSMIDSLEVLLGFCADTVDYNLTDETTEPLTAASYERFDEDRLQAVYKLCPSAPTAKLMRQVIYNQ